MWACFFLGGDLFALCSFLFSCCCFDCCVFSVVVVGGGGCFVLIQFASGCE